MAGRSKYTAEQRKNALELSEKMTLAEASRETGIPASTIRCWRMEAAPHGRADKDPIRKSNGTFQKGHTGNPGGRSSAIAQAERLAAEASVEVMVEFRAVLHSIRDKREEEGADALTEADFDRLLAVGDRLLDRGLGKPTQRQELTGADGGALTVTIEALTEARREAAQLPGAIEDLGADELPVIDMDEDE